MVNTLSKSDPKPPKTGIKTPTKETILTPRFYTTDFDTAASLDLSAQGEELRTMLEEMRTDYNRYHFVRDEAFERSWEQIDGEARRSFIEYLEWSWVLLNSDMKRNFVLFHITQNHRRFQQHHQK